jgi:hypothetical protein
LKTISTGLTGRTALRLAVACGIACMVTPAPALTEADLYRVFDEQHITYDADTIRQHVISGILAAVDPCARILSSNDVHELESQAAVAITEHWGQGIRYLKLNGLFREHEPAVGEALRDWATQEASGLLLDLRGAGGQDLAAIAGLAGLFNKADDPLFEVADRAGQVRERFRRGSNALQRVTAPLMVLVDRDTRGASEVLAAVLQGQPDVAILGLRTHGHTGVMETIAVTEQTSISLATGWVSLGHKDEDFAAGIQPDILVSNALPLATMDLPLPGKQLEGKVLSEKARLDRELMERVSGDPVLRRATDVLLALRALHDGSVASGAPPARDVP